MSGRGALPTVQYFLSPTHCVPSLHHPDGSTQVSPLPCHPGAPPVSRSESEFSSKDSWSISASWNPAGHGAAAASLDPCMMPATSLAKKLKLERLSCGSPGAQPQGWGGTITNGLCSGCKQAPRSANRLSSPWQSLRQPGVVGLPQKPPGVRSDLERTVQLRTLDCTGQRA